MLSNTFEYIGKLFSVLGIHVSTFVSDRKTISYPPLHREFCQLRFSVVDKPAEDKVANISEE